MTINLTLTLDQASRLETIANNSDSISVRLLANAFIVASKDGFKEVVSSSTTDFYSNDVEYAIKRLEKLSKEAEQRSKEINS